MAEQKTSKPTKRLFEYADNYKYLTIASWVLATVSAFIALCTILLYLEAYQRGNPCITGF